MKLALALICAALLAPTAFAQSTWTAISTVTPPPPAGLDHAVMIYDKGRAVTVLYTADSTYEYAGTDWQQINTPNSPGIFETLAVLGQGRTVSRVADAIERIEARAKAG